MSESAAVRRELDRQAVRRRRFERFFGIVFFVYVATLLIAFARVDRPILGMHPNLLFAVETAVLLLGLPLASHPLKVRCPRCSEAIFPARGSHCRQCGGREPGRQVPNFLWFRVHWFGAAGLIAGIILYRHPLIGGFLCAVGIPTLVLGLVAAPYLYCTRCASSNSRPLNPGRSRKLDPPNFCSMCGLDLRLIVREIFQL